MANACTVALTAIVLIGTGTHLTESEHTMILARILLDMNGVLDTVTYGLAYQLQDLFCSWYLVPCVIHGG